MTVNRPDTSLRVELEGPDGTFYLDPHGEPAYIPLGANFSDKLGEGFATGSFRVRRLTTLDWPDLQLLHTVRILATSGEIVWEGRVVGTPRSLGDSGHEIEVSAVGFMTLTRRRPFAEVYVDRRADQWREPTLNRRLTLAAEDKPHGTDFSASIDRGTLSFDALTGKVVNDESEVDLMYAAPSGALIGEVQYRGSDFNTTGLDARELFAADDDTLTLGSWEAYSQTLDATVRSNALTTPRRFVLLRMSANNTDPTFSAATPPKYIYTAIAVYGDHGLTLRDNGDEPDGLYASDVMRDICQRFCGRISPAGIRDTGVALSQVAFTEPTDAYDAFAYLASFHDDWNIAVWEGPTLYFSQTDFSRADWEVRAGEDGCTTRLDGDDIENVANGVVISYDDIVTGPSILYPDDHDEIRSDDPDNPWNKIGEPGWVRYSVDFPTTEEDALRIGAVYLTELNRPKLPGSIEIQNDHIPDAQGNLHPSWEPRSGQTVAVANHPNDRPRRITSKSYDREGKRLVLAVDGGQTGIASLVANVQNRREARGL